MLEIFFDDLTKEAQKRVLEFLGLQMPRDRNYDAFPLFVMEEGG